MYIQMFLFMMYIMDNNYNFITEFALLQSREQNIEDNYRFLQSQGLLSPSHQKRYSQPTTTIVANKESHQPNTSMSNRKQSQKHPISDSDS